MRERERSSGVCKSECVCGDKSVQNAVSVMCFADTSNKGTYLVHVWGIT